MKAKTVHESFVRNKNPLRTMGVGVEFEEFEAFADRLRAEHPRSGYTEKFIDKVYDLLYNDVEFVPRNEFKLTIGPQWGQEWIDEIVEAGILKLIKKGFKPVLVNPESEMAKNFKPAAPPKKTGPRRRKDYWRRHRGYY